MSSKLRQSRPQLRRDHRLAALVLSILSPGVFIAKGQDALFNAVTIQSDINPPAAAFVPTPEQPHLGPVNFNLSAFSGITYNDNINDAQVNTESDVISQTGINLGLEWPATEHSDLKINSGIGYLHYFRYTVNSGLTVTPGSILDYALSWNEASLTFYDQASYTRQVTAEAALANIATLPQFGNTAGVLGEWDPGHWTFQTSYSHVINISDSAHDYLNSTLEQFFGRAGWRFASATQAGVESSGGLTSYQKSSQSNNTSYSIGAYLEWQVKSWLQLTARGGPTYYDFYSQSPGVADSSLNTYYVSIAANHQITDFLSENFSLLRSIELSANQGSSYVQQLTAAYSLSWALTKQLNLSGSLTYDNGKQPLVIGYDYLFGIIPIPLQATENYQLYSGTLSASWEFTGHFSASLSYSHTRRDSNLSERSYSANAVTAQLTYDF